MRPEDPPSTFVYFPCSRDTFHKLSERHRDIPSTSVYILCSREIFCQLSVRPIDLPSTFRAVYRHSVSFHKLSVWSGYSPSTSVNFLHGLETFRQPPLTFCSAGRLTVNFRLHLCCRGIFCQLQSTLRTAGRPLIYFRHQFVRPEDLPSTFRVARRPSVNFTCGVQTFRQLNLLNVQPGDLLSTSFNFVCGQETFRQHFLRSEDLLCTSVNFIYGRENFRRLLSNFLANGRPFVNFCQLLCSQETFRYLPKVSLLHGNFMEVKERSRGRRETTQKLSISLAAAEKTSRRLTEGLPAKRQVDVRSTACTES